MYLYCVLSVRTLLCRRNSMTWRKWAPSWRRYCCFVCSYDDVMSLVLFQTCVIKELEQRQEELEAVSAKMKTLEEVLYSNWHLRIWPSIRRQGLCTQNTAFQFTVCIDLKICKLHEISCINGINLLGLKFNNYGSNFMGYMILKLSIRTYTVVIVHDVYSIKKVILARLQTVQESCIILSFTGIVACIGMGGITNFLLSTVWV